MNRYNIFNRLIIEPRLKNSRFIICVPNVSNLKTSTFQIATASVAADESEGRSGREQIPASGEAALVPQPGMSKRSELQCTDIVCHPSLDWGGRRRLSGTAAGGPRLSRWPQVLPPAPLFSSAGPGRVSSSGLAVLHRRRLSPQITVWTAPCHHPIRCDWEANLSLCFSQ